MAQHAGDEALLELAHGVVELDAAVDHFLDELLETVTNHGSRGPTPARSHSRVRARSGRRRSSRLGLLEFPAGQPAERFKVFLPRFFDDVRRQRRHGRPLVPANPFEVVADELLVEARLRATRLVAVARP